MGRIKTFEFTYDIKIDDFGSIQFCAEKKEEAIELFKSWCKENNYQIDDYKVFTVYEESDKEAYGDDYFM